MNYAVYPMCTHLHYSLFLSLLCRAIVKLNGDNFSSQLLASGVAAIACVVSSLPFDMIKVRRMWGIDCGLLGSLLCPQN